MKATFGPYILDAETGELWKDVDPVRLAPQPTRILILLVERAGRLVAREEIKRLLWDQETFVDFDQSLNACIRQIRSALNDNADRPAFVETLPRRGYRFIADVIALPAPPIADISENTELGTFSPVADSTSLPPGAEHDRRPALQSSAVEALPETVQSSEPLEKSIKKHLLPTVAAFALAAIALAVGYLYYRSVHRASVQASTSIAQMRAQARPTMAVLCFQNSTGRVQDAWISSALAEMLTTEMTSDDHMRVIPSEDVVQARKDLGLVGESGESDTDLGNLRHSLGSDLFVSGSYTVVNTAAVPSLQVQVHVRDMSTGAERTQFSETGDLSNLYGLVNETARHLSTALLAGQNGNAEDVQQPGGLSGNQDAVRSYTEGLDLYRNYDDQGARGLFERAIQADSNFAMAHSMLAQVWSDLDNTSRAQSEAAEAVRLSTHLPRVQKLSIEAFYHQTKYEYDQATSIYRALWTFYPDDAEWGLLLAGVQEQDEQTQAVDMGAYTTMESLRKLPLTPRQEAGIDWLEAEHFADIGDFEKNPETIKKARALLAAAIQIAQKQKSQLIMGTTLRAKCMVLMKSNALVEGTEACAQARSIFEAAGNRSAVASETDNMAIAAQRRGDLKGAAEGYEEARKAFHDAGSMRDEMSMVDNIVNVQRVLGNLDAQIKGAEDLIRSHDTGSDETYHWRGDLDLSGALLQKAEVKSATEAALASIKAVSGKTPSKNNEGFAAESKELLGRLYLASGDAKEAEHYLAESLELRKKSGDPEILAESTMAQAAFEVDQKHTSEATADALHKAVAIFAKDVDAPPYQMNAEVQLARVELLLGKPAEAAQAIVDAEALHGKGDWPEIYLDLQLAEAQVEEAQGRIPAAMQTLAAEVDRSNSTGYVLRETQGQIALARLKLKAQPTAETVTTLQNLSQRARQMGLKRLATDASHTRGE